MKRTLILFATKYGSTQQIAESLATKLEVKHKNVMYVEDKAELEKYDVLILGTPIYNDDIHEDMKHFINTFSMQINEKILFLYVVHGATKGYLVKDYTNTFSDYFQKDPALKMSFVGRATKTSLSHKDFRKLQIFYINRLDAEFEDFDHFDENNLDDASNRIRRTISNDIGSFILE